MIKTIDTKYQQINGFEGHIHAETGATTLCLEKILCLAKAIESGEEIPAANVIHYTTSRIKKRKRRRRRKLEFSKKVQINKHHYDLAIPSFGKMGNWGDGNHRTFAYKITQISQPINQISENDWTVKKIPEKIKTDFSNVKIVSDYTQVEQRKEKYSIPEELKLATRFPTDKEIEDFFNERKNQKITYMEIINNLYE